MTAAGVGMLCELHFSLPVTVKNIQHATMYFFFGLPGLIGVLAPILNKILPNVENIKFLLVVMAYIVEAILFKFHLIGRNMLDTAVHTLLVYSIYGCIIMTLGETILSNHVLPSLGRSFFTILQGTWFWQVGYILYVGHFEPDNHEHIMFATCTYTWHIGGLFLFSLSCGVGLACCYRKRGEHGDAELTLAEPVANGYKHLTIQEDVETVVDVDI